MNEINPELSLKGQMSRLKLIFWTHCAKVSLPCDFHNAKKDERKRMTSNKVGALDYNISECTIEKTLESKCLWNIFN